MITPTRVRSKMADTTPRVAPMVVTRAVQILLSIASVPSEPISSLFESGRGVVSKHEVDFEHEVKSEHVMVVPFPASNVVTYNHHPAPYEPTYCILFQHYSQVIGHQQTPFRNL